MPASWVASGTLLGSTGADITPVIPAHLADDILLLAASSRSSGQTVATPAGWTPLTSISNINGISTDWFWIRAAAAGTTNPLCDYLDATAEHVANVHVIRGARKSGNPFDATQASTSSSTNPVGITGVTTSEPGIFVFSSGHSFDNTATAVAVAATDPTSMTQRAYTTITTGADFGQWFADGIQVNLGATGTCTHTFTGSPFGIDVLIAAVLVHAPPSRNKISTILQAVRRSTY